MIERSDENDNRMMGYCRLCDRINDVKTGMCICENNDTDQLCSNCEADLCLCFRYRDSTILLLSEKVPACSCRLWLYSVVCV